MSDLSKLNLKISYSSDCSNVVTDFYNPCLAQSCLYRRAVGYFTSSGWALAAQGIIHLLKNSGRIQLIASPVLTEEDIQAINEGYEKRDVVVLAALKRELNNIENTLVKDRLSALAWLIASNALECKINNFPISINWHGLIIPFWKELVENDRHIFHKQF